MIGLTSYRNEVTKCEHQGNYPSRYGKSAFLIAAPWKMLVAEYSGLEGGNRNSIIL
ncbi:hypothetical protein ACFQ9Y_14345 [Peribacillus simplex]|uniref:hypothetical protein n=1 Tax=Peribacillus simplex TaxID=1478 RepID=UPI00366EEB57